MDGAWISAGLGVVFAAIGYLLSHKDKQQAKEMDTNKAAHEKKEQELTKQMADQKAEHDRKIDELFRLHAMDVQRLNDVELHIAKNHYEKTELDARFHQLEAVMHAGFAEIRDSIKELTLELREHREKELQSR